jgi:hypothetical protein
MKHLKQDYSKQKNLDSKYLLKNLIHNQYMDK